MYVPMAKCSSCGKDNPNNGQFCIFCGVPLRSQNLASMLGTESGEIQAERSNPHLSALLEEIKLNRSQLESLATRITAAERLLGTGISQAFERNISRSSQALPTAEPPSTGRTLPPNKKAGSYITARNWDWEWLLGGNWLARIGVLALILGMGFFLRLAFDNNWIGETGRVAVGVLVGLGFLGAGEFSKRRYPSWAQTLIGGGIAILYLSLYAAFALYQLLGTIPTFGLFCLVTVTASILALRYESKTIAVLGIFGGFTTPLVMWERLPDQWLLISYVLLLDMGVLALATFRTWRWLTLLGMVGSSIVYGLWYWEFGDGADLLLAQGGLTVIFLIFVGATSIFHLIWRRQTEATDFTLILLNASYFLGASYWILWDEYRDWLGSFTLLLALFYSLFAYGALRRGPQQAPLALLISGIALVLIAVAVPVQIDGPWICIAWATEAGALMWIALQLRVPQLRVIALGILAILAVRLLTVETWVDQETFRLILNHRVVAFGSGIISLYVVVYLAYRSRHLLLQWELRLIPYLLLFASFFTLWLMSAEAISYFERDANLDQWALELDSFNAQTLSLSVIWALYGSMILTIGMLKGWTGVRLGGLTVLSLVILKVFLVDSFALEEGYRVAAYLILGVLLVMGGLFYQRHGEIIRKSLRK
jgi:uncharacterized membrane protein